MTILKLRFPLAVFVLALAAYHSSSQAPALDNNPAHPRAVPRVHVFFGQSKVLTVQEVEDVARQALKERGYVFDPSYPCAINVVVSGSSAGCVVLFHRGLGEMGYDVSLGTNGEVKNVIAAKTEHGVPPKGGPKPVMPSGGVKRSNP